MPKEGFTGLGGPQDNTAMTEASLAGAVSTCQRSGAAGWDLVDQASRLVHDRFTTYSMLHVWERPQTAFRRRRGYCTQNNGALAQILRRLGFDAWLVYTARVRFDNNPEWTLGQTWVRVRLDGDVRDVCARSVGNRPGSVGFTSLGRVHRFGPVARVASGVGTAVAALAAVLLARLRAKVGHVGLSTPAPATDRAPPLLGCSQLAAMTSRSRRQRCGRDRMVLSSRSRLR
jgi:N-acetyltransferase